MSSSQDSDIDIECSRVIKPKKFFPKFFNSLFIDQMSTSSSDDKAKSKRNKTMISCESKHTSNPSNKFVRRMPIAIGILQKRNSTEKNVKFNIEGSGKISSPRTSEICSSSDKKGKKGVKLRFFEQDSEKIQETAQLFGGIAEQTQNITAVTRTVNRTRTKQKGSKLYSSKLGQQTTPIFSSHRNRTQIIKQYNKDGNRIRTNWLKGQINGYTEIDYEDSGRFRGIFQSGQIVSGEMSFSNGFVYTGQFQMFTFHGQGKFKFPSGQIFQGNWLFGSLNGNGKIIYPQGQIYYGQIRNFKRDGEGYLYFSNGEKYVGEFQKGQITGFGQLHKDGVLTKKGFWINGKFIGQNGETYKQKKQEMEQLKKNKQKQKQNYTQSIHQSLRNIKKMHQKIQNGYSDQKESKVDNILQKQQQFTVLQSSNLFFQTVNREPPINQSGNYVRNRLKKQISLSLKII